MENDLIARFTTARTGEIPIEYDIPGNPFHMDEAEEPEDRFSDTFFTRSAPLNPAFTPNNRSLIDIAMSTKPRVPPVLTRSTSVVHTSLSVSRRLPPPIDPSTVPKVERKQTMNELMKQKREIYISSLISGMKTKQIRNFELAAARAEESLDKEMKDLTTQVNKHKKRSAKLSQSLILAKKAERTAANILASKEKELKKKQTEIQMLRSSIEHYTDPIASLKCYRQFLLLFCPNGAEPADFLQDPDQLIDELKTIEEDNLFIDAQIQQITEKLENDTVGIRKEIQSADEEQSNFSSIMDSEPDKPSAGTILPSFSESGSEDSELKELRRIIGQSYTKCFSKVTNMSTIKMLSHIEGVLESMYATADKISPKFISDKWAEKDCERREKVRSEKQKQSELDQQKKIDEAIQRARQPIKKRVGRPINERVLPKHLQRVGTSEANRKIREQKKQKDLLYKSEE